MNRINWIDWIYQMNRIDWIDWNDRIDQTDGMVSQVLPSFEFGSLPEVY